MLQSLIVIKLIGKLYMQQLSTENSSQVILDSYNEILDTLVAVIPLPITYFISKCNCLFIVT